MLTAWWCSIVVGNHKGQDIFRRDGTVVRRKLIADFAALFDRAHRSMQVAIAHRGDIMPHWWRTAIRHKSE